MSLRDATRRGTSGAPSFATVVAVAALIPGLAISVLAQQAPPSSPPGLSRPFDRLVVPKARDFTLRDDKGAVIPSGVGIPFYQIAREDGTRLRLESVAGEDAPSIG